VSSSLSNRDLVTLASDLDSVETGLNNLRSERDKQFSWAKDTTAFKLNEFYSDSDRFINAGLYGVEAMRELSVIVTPFADAAGLKVFPDQEMPQQEGLMEAFQMWVSLMPEVAGKMDGVIEKVSMVGN
jgi:hypothetical protein